MDFTSMNQPHQQQHFYNGDGTIYEGIATISAGSSPGTDFEYSNLVAPTPTPLASPYNFPVRGVQTPITPDPSPVDHVQVEFTDLSAPYPEDRNYRPRKQDGSRQPSTSMHMRRRAQNRASQRAFRERKEKHTQELQRRLTEVEQQYDELKQQYEVVHREKTQLEAQTRRCSCGGCDDGDSSIRTGDAESCGHSSGEDEPQAPFPVPSREGKAVNHSSTGGLQDMETVYEVVDWSVVGQ